MGVCERSFVTHKVQTPSNSEQKDRQIFSSPLWVHTVKIFVCNFNWNQLLSVITSFLPAQPSISNPLHDH